MKENKTKFVCSMMNEVRRVSRLAAVSLLMSVALPSAFAGNNVYIVAGGEGVSNSITVQNWEQHIYSWYSNQLESVWTGFPALPDGFDALEKTLSLQKRFANKLNGLDYCDASRRIDHPSGIIYRLEFQGESGVSFCFSSWCTAKIQRPLSLLAVGFPSTDDVSAENTIAFVRKEIVGESANSAIHAISRALRLDKLTIKGVYTGKKYFGPFDSGWLFFIDDRPGANWAHPCRYVFVSKKLESFAVLYSNEPCTVLEGETCLEFDMTPDAKHVESSVDDGGFKSFRKSINAVNISNALAFDKGDKSRTYAVLISGGGRPSENYSRYWGDVAMVYSTLRNQYSIPKENIKVCVSSGNSSDKDMLVATSETYESSPLDLDGDGVADIAYSATKSQIKSVFADLASTLTERDQLFVFVTDHGTQDGDTGVCYLIPWLGSTSTTTTADACISESEFADYIKDIAAPMAIAMEFCYSGAFIDNITSQPNRVVATACGVEPSSAWAVSPSEDSELSYTITNPYDYCNPWAWAFNSAIRGSDSLWGWSPWNSDSASSSQVGNADSDGDGLVSIYEAAQLADSFVRDFSIEITAEEYGIYNENWTFCDAPQYGESSNGFGKSFFILNQSNPSIPTIPAAPSPYVDGTTLKWNVVAGANYYKVYRATNPYAEPEEYSGWQSGTSKSIVKPSSEGTAYFWFVKAASAQDDKTASGFSETKVVTGDSNYTLLPYSSAHTHTTYNEKTEFHLYPSTSSISATPYNGSLTLTSTITFTKSAGSGITAKINGTDVANSPAIGNGGLYMGSASFAISAASNTSTTPRSCLFHSNATAPSGYTASDGQAFGKHYREWYGRPHYIYQAGVTSMSIGQTSQSVPADGGTYSVSVTATPSTASWTASVNRDWVHLFRTSSNGSGVLGYYVEPNDGSARSATITVAGKTLSVSQASGIVEQKVTVSFVSNDGTSCSPREYTVGSTYGSLPSTTRTGYTFDGWYATSSFTTKVTTGSTVSASVTKLYAKWTANTYTVSYSLGGGVAGTYAPISGVFDTAFRASAPTQNGKVFAGWTVSSGLDSTTAKWGTSSGPSTSISSSSTICANGESGDVWFLNLRSTSGTVTLTANWEDAPSPVIENFDVGFYWRSTLPRSMYLGSDTNVIPDEIHRVSMSAGDDEHAPYLVWCVSNNGHDKAVDNVPFQVTIQDATGASVHTEPSYDITLPNAGYNRLWSGGYWLGPEIRALGPGNYKICAELDPEDTLGDTNRIDNVRLFPFAVLPETEIPFAEALGCADFSFSVQSDSDAPFGQVFDGTSCVQFGPQCHSTTNSLVATVSGAGQLAFQWKASCENGYDWLDFFADGAIVQSITGISSGWSDVTAELGDGTHEFKWCYCKDDSVDSGLDAVFVRNVTWTPNTAIQIAKPVVVASGNADYVQLDWDPVDNAAGYAVWRATSASGTKQRVQVPIGTMNTYNIIDGVGTYIQSFIVQDTTATPGVDYWYWIAATNGTASTFSDPVSDYRRVSLSVKRNGSAFSTLPFDAEAASDSVAVTANTSWEAWSSKNWVTTSPSNANGSATMSIAVTANTDSSSRTANVTVEAGGDTAHSVVKNFIVFQDAPPQPKVITVTFDSNGGIGTMAAQTFQEGERKVLTASAFTKSGFHFLGWSEDPDATVAAYADGESFTPTDDVILYAVWRSNKHAVEFHANGGTGTMKAQTFTWNVAKEISACTFTREHYVFTGWATNENGAVVYADQQPIQIDEALELWAVWSPETYSVTFNGNGATSGAMAAQSFTYGAAQNLNVNAFQKTGHDFKGWATVQGGAVVYVDGALFSATENTTLWAVWEPKTFNVTFNGNGATSGTMAAQSFTYGTAQNLNANAFQKTGHDFKGWATTQGGAVVYADGASFTATENTTLWAVWEAKTFNVTFNGNGATSGAMAAQSFTYGVAQNLNANAFQKTGHDFKGWATSSGGAVVYADGALFSATKNTTLWAVWEAKTFMVTFNGNGATSGTMAAQSFTYGTAQNLNANAFEKTGHDFKGWATTQGGAVVYTDGAPFSATENTTLWAVWEAKTLTVRFLANDGTDVVLGSQKFTYGVAARLETPTPEREGYTLAGWARSANGGVAYNGGETVAFEDDTDLYAVWSAGLGAALAGTEYLVWITSDDAPWTGVALDGEDVARSGAISDYESSWVRTEVTGPGRLTFRWKVSSESYRDYQIDYLSFCVDDEEMDWIGGEVDWESKTFDLGEGTHTLTWTYFKDEADFDGEDCAWLDDVFFLHRSSVSFVAPDATSGTLPGAIDGWENDEVTLPASGDLRRAKHEFAGWTDGTATFAPGDSYTLPATAVTLSAVWTAKIVATPEIETPACYTNETSAVSIACATPGATIHYTLDGSDPLGAGGMVYAGPFSVSGCPTILAAATLDGWFDSAVATVSVSRVWTAAEVLNATDRFFDLRSDVPWTRDLSVSHDGIASLRSGAITNGESTAFSTAVYGSGTVSFWWKVSSEIYKNRKIDYLSFLVDGAESAWIGGERDWTNYSAKVSGDGTHTLSWIYSKDSEGSAGDDAGWVDEFLWTSDGSAYIMVDAGDVGMVAVERAWLEEKFPGADVSISAAGLAANGKPIWQAYVAGYDPTDPNADFRAKIRIVNGIPVVEPDPDLGDTRTYVVEGKPTLTGTWGEPDGDSRFFRIRVQAPEVSAVGGNAAGALAAPTGVSATNDREDGVLVSWQAVADATTYELWKGDAGTSDPSSLVGTGAETNRLDPDALPGVSSRYWVRAIGAAASSPLSVPVEGMKRLSAPQNVNVVSSGEPVALSWDVVTGATSYEVWRAQTDDVSAAEKIGETEDTSYTDNSLSRGLKYWYWVKPVNGAAEGSLSASMVGWRLLERPTGVTASQGTEATGVLITWNAVDGAVSYNVLRSSNANDYDTIGTTTTASFLDPNPGISGTWYYVIEAVGRDVGSVGYSSYAAGYQGIAAPSEVSATQGEDFNAVTVMWSAVDGASRYTIWRSASSSISSATCIYPSGTTSYSYRDTTAYGGTNYYYWVKSHTGCGAVSGFSPRALGYNAKIASIGINGVSTLYGVGAQGCYGAMAQTQSGKILPLPANPIWELVTTGHVNKVSIPSGFTDADIISNNKSACFAVTNAPTAGTISSKTKITIKVSCTWQGTAKSATKAITISAADSSAQYSSYIAGTNAAIVLGAYSGTATSVTVPTTFNGGAVKGLNGTFNNTAVASVTIPATIVAMSANTFANCASLSTITVNSSNPNFCSENGILFNKSKTTLRCYPPKKTGTSYVVPDSVTSLSSLSGLAYLTSIYIPARVTSFPTLGTTSLRQIYFFGNRPSTDFINGIKTTSGTAYYLQGTTGWGDTFGSGLLYSSGGIPTAVWSNPVKSLAISGSTSVMSSGKATFTATGTFQSGHSVTYAGSPITWAITSGSDYASISDSGVLTANAVTSAQTVIIKATAALGGGTATATKTITITP